MQIIGKAQFVKYIKHLHIFIVKLLQHYIKKNDVFWKKERKKETTEVRLQWLGVSVLYSHSSM